ncbi:MAG: response regulator transcription factor [Planctomycetota bacterium]
MIRVIIADDHQLVREGLAALLATAEDIEVAALASDGVEALEHCATHRPSVLLLDLHMPVLDALGVLTRLRREPEPPGVLVLTTFDDTDAMLKAIGLGALGFLLKDLSREELTHAVRSIANGERVFMPTLSSTVRDAAEQLQGVETDRAAPVADLTSRELEILRLIAGGLANKQIASALGLSEGTVKNYVSAVLMKLGVNDRTRAVMKALERGLL